jgi:sialate O-acetylesterase
VRLTFKDAGAGLSTSNGADVHGFLVAGSDRRWHPARVQIRDGNTLVLESSSVTRPVAVRYGWNDHPVLNLVNSDGLPATPFRTDSWPVSTQGR